MKQLLSQAQRNTRETRLWKASGFAIGTCSVLVGIAALLTHNIAVGCAAFILAAGCFLGNYLTKE